MDFFCFIRKKDIKNIFGEKYLSQKLSIDILKIKKVAPNYVTKEENGIFKIKSLQNDFLSYEGGYVNGRKHGYGKEYKLEKVELKLCLLLYKEDIKKLNLNIPNDINKSDYFLNKKFNEELKMGTVNMNGKEYIYFKKLDYEGDFKNDQREGKGKEYDIFGRLIFEGEYIKGKRNGKGKKYDKKGKLVFEGEFKNEDWPEKGKEYDRNGNLIFEGEFKNEKRWNGKGNEYDRKGNLIFEGEYQNGKKWNGKGNKYDFSNVEIIFEGEIKNGKRWNGKGKEIVHNEYCLQFEGEYNNGIQSDGKILKYYNNRKFEGEIIKGILRGKEYEGNRLIFEGEYTNGKIISYKNENENESVLFPIYDINGEKWNGKEKEYYKEGNLKFEGEYINGIRYGKEYDIKGNLIYNGDYSNVDINNKSKENNCRLLKDKYINWKRWNGNGKEFYNNGNLRFDGEYYLGEKNGKEYNPKGNLIFKGEYLNEKKWKGKLIESNTEIHDGNYKGKEYDNYGNLIFEDFFSSEKKSETKRLRKVYDDKNNFLFEIEIDDKFELEKNKKKNLLEIYSVYEKNGLTIEKGKEINFEENSIFEGEFYNKEKIDGIIKVYYNLKIENFDENILFFEGEYKNGKINGKGKKYDMLGN